MSRGGTRQRSLTRDGTPAFHRRYTAASALALGHVTTRTTHASSKALLVSNDNDAGPGSFRDAVARANADAGVSHIQFTGQVSVIALQQTVQHTGAQALRIDGNSATIDGSGVALGAAFLATGGGDLEISRLTVRNAPAEGIAVEVPSSATGTLRVSLFRVEISGNRGHGVLVNDREDPSAPDGVQPNANGSAASVDVPVVNSRFTGNGYSVSDRDGLRVNEGGDGDLVITVKHSVAADNAADGIEVDERGAGDVRVDVFGAEVVRNGQFDPEDLDDGFDIDEYDDGSVIGTIAFTNASDNFEEGLDVNENNAGDLRVDLTNVVVSGNREKGVGDLVAVVSGVEAAGNLSGGIDRATATGNTGRGVDFDENSSGDLEATLSDAASTGNIDVDLRADQQAPGAGSFVVSNVIYATTGGDVAPTP